MALITVGASATAGGASLRLTEGLVRAVADTGLKPAAPAPDGDSLNPKAVRVFHSPSVMVPSTNGLLEKTRAQTLAFGAPGKVFTGASTNAISVQSDGFWRSASALTAGERLSMGDVPG